VGIWIPEKLGIQMVHFSWNRASDNRSIRKLKHICPVFKWWIS
jgi:hypothetical protein